MSSGYGPRTFSSGVLVFPPADLRGWSGEFEQHGKLTLADMKTNTLASAEPAPAPEAESDESGVCPICAGGQGHSSGEVMAAGCVVGACALGAGACVVLALVCQWLGWI